MLSYYIKDPHGNYHAQTSFRPIGVFTPADVPPHPKRGMNWAVILLQLDVRTSLLFREVTANQVNAIRGSLSSLTKALGRKTHRYATRLNRDGSLYIARIR